MDNLHQVENDPQLNLTNKNPPNNISGTTAHPTTIKLASGNPEYLLQSEDIHHRKETPNTRKKRAPPPTHVPNDLPPTSTSSSRSISTPDISAPVTPEPLLNEAYSYSPPRCISEAPSSPPKKPRPHFATLHSPAANTRQYSASGYPNGSSNINYISPGYMYAAQTSSPERPHPQFSRNTAHCPPGHMSAAQTPLPERFLPSSDAPHNPTCQYPVESYPNIPRNSSYSHPRYISAASNPPRPQFTTLHSPASVNPQYPTSGYSGSSRSASYSPRASPHPHSTTLHNPTTFILQHPIGIYPDSSRNTVDHEPILRWHVAAPTIDIAAATPLQTIAIKWVRTACARKMVVKLNEIEKRHVEGAQRFAALMKSLEENTLAIGGGNGQLDADAKPQSDKLPPYPVSISTTEAYPVPNTPPAPRGLAPRSDSNSEPDENNVCNEDYLATLCNIS